MRFATQCSRCDGKGRYDRGTCFGCNGRGYKNLTSKPSRVNEYHLKITFENGSSNFVTMFAHSRNVAIDLVNREVRANGWKGEVAQ